MNFAFTAEEEALCRELEAFWETEIPADLRWVLMFLPTDTSDRRIQILWRETALKLGQRGWFSITWPRQWGGQEASHVVEFMLIEEMMYHGGLGFDLQGISLVAPLLLHFGNDEQRSRFLPPIARGEVNWSQCFSEPDSGSDLASLKSGAVPDGTSFIINGQKVWSSRAHLADWLHVLARTSRDSKHGGISYFLVDAHSPGITINPLSGIYGGESMCEVFFDNVRVPAANLVGRINEGWSMVLAILEVERALYMEQIGTARHALEILVAYANEQGLSRDTILRHSLAEMAIEIEVARLLNYQTARLLDRGLPAAAEGSMCKIVSTEWAQRWANRAMAVLGQYSQLSEDSELAQLAGKIQHWYIRSFGFTIASGTSEIERSVLARQGLGLPGSQTDQER